MILQMKLTKAERDEIVSDKRRLLSRSRRVENTKIRIDYTLRPINNLRKRINLRNEGDLWSFAIQRQRQRLMQPSLNI